MPQSWIPVRKRLQDEIAEEIAKGQQSRELAKQAILADMAAPAPQSWQPVTSWPNSPMPAQSVVTPDIAQPKVPEPMPQSPNLFLTRREPRGLPSPVPPAPSLTTIPTTPVPETQLGKIPEQVPFWKRALDVFNAPFDWVDNNIIKPGLSVIGDPLIPNVKRQEGEDFFDWKRREWEEWKAPGVTMKMPWGDWRVDVKGIAEFAPWLLIPGSNAVGGTLKAIGTAAKAGTALSKISPALKVVGAAIQYSPWGLVEKGTGVVLKAVAKPLLGQADKLGTKVAAKLYGPLPAQVTTPAEQRFTTFFKDIVKPLYDQFQKIGKPALRARQGKLVADIRQRYLNRQITTSEYEKLTKQAMSGGVKSQYAVPQAQLAAINPQDVDELLRKSVQSVEKGLTAQDTHFALLNLLTNGELPQPHHIREFVNVFGRDFAQTIGKLKYENKTAFGKALDVLNVPRAVLASLDLSGMARQGLILGLTHPTRIPRAFWRQLKAFASEKLTLEMDDVLRSNPIAREFTDIAGGYIAPQSKAASMFAREESFPSQLAEKLPFVRRSERAFNTYLNELRLGSYEAARNAWIAQGATDKELKVLGSFINQASGRGELPFAIEKYAPLLNTFFFSPRLQASRLELPKTLGKMLLSENPYMRKEAARALTTFLGGGTSLLMLLKGMGVADVETDPRSADWGKIKFKNTETRLDIWTGYVQYARMVAQMLTGETKSAYGNINKKSRYDIAYKFLQSKTSPAFGLIVDLLKGESYEGKPLFTGTSTALEATRQRIMPLLVQDLMDAFEQGGTNGLFQSAPAALGVGALTYVNKFVQVKDRLAKENGKESWADLDPITQRRLEDTQVFQAAALQFDRDVMGTAWGDWRAVGNAIESNFKDEIGLASEQYAATGDGYKFREKVADAYTARRGGYDVRAKEERFSEIANRLNSQLTEEALVKLGPEQLAIKVYMDALHGTDMVDEFGDYRFDEADKRRGELRQSLGDEMFQYVEEYLGMKYDDYPPIFQELRRAKTVLKPYWGVQDEVEALYGKPQTESQLKRRDALVSKVRARMKRSSPEVARYIELFYTRPEA